MSRKEYVEWYKSLRKDKPRKTPHYLLFVYEGEEYQVINTHSGHVLKPNKGMNITKIILEVVC